MLWVNEYTVTIDFGNYLSQYLDNHQSIHLYLTIHNPIQNNARLITQHYSAQGRKEKSVMYMECLHDTIKHNNN